MSEPDNKLSPEATPELTKTPGIKTSEGYRMLTDILKKRGGGFGGITSSGFD